jgi:putative restriction endonuclease
MISGCLVLQVLEAAHIRPHRGQRDNHPENGLLLRADLHTLFDLDLLGIEPSTLTVHLHQEADTGEDKSFHGRMVCCSAGQRPSAQALRTRWKIFRELYARPCWSESI